MFLLSNRETGYPEFYWEDPRQHGYDGIIVEHVDLLVPNNLFDVAEGERYRDWSEFCLGSSKSNGKKFRVFKSKEECIEAEFAPLGPQWAQLETWRPDGCNSRKKNGA